MDKKLGASILVVVFCLIVSAILAGNYDDVVKNIYTQEAHNVTLDDGSVVLTPAPILTPSLQVKIWGLAPIGVWIGGGLALFFMWFTVGKGGVKGRN